MREWDGFESQKLFVSKWRQTFIILPRISTTGVTIRPFSTVYTRQREIFAKGQRLLSDEWMSGGEYVIMLLKNKTNGTA